MRRKCSEDKKHFRNIIFLVAEYFIISL